MPHHHHVRRAFTLFELLAVVVVLGLVAVLAMPGLAHRAAGDPLDHAVQQVLSEEQRLRCLAVGHGLRLDLTDSGFTAQLEQGLTGQDDPRVETRLDPAYIVTWSHNGHAVHELVIDRRGRSLDLEVAVERERSERRYRLSGLSGEWNEVETP